MTDALPEAGSPTGLIRVTYQKSCVGYSRRQKETIRSLGLKRIGETRVHSDTPAVRGMLHHVRHLVTAEPIEEVQVVATDAPIEDQPSEFEE